MQRATRNGYIFLIGTALTAWLYGMSGIFDSVRDSIADSFPLLGRNPLVIYIMLVLFAVGVLYHGDQNIDELFGLSASVSYSR